MTQRRSLVGLRRRVAAGALAWTAVLLVPAMPHAQSSPSVTFTLDQRLEGSRNTRLTIPSEGNALQSVTRLGFDLETSTRVEQLRLSGAAAIRLGRSPGDRLDTVDDPQFRLSYVREGVDSGFSVAASVRRSQLEFLRLSDFLDEDGELDLPEDFEDLARTGRRTAYNLDAGLVLGREAAPLGLSLTLGVGGIDYSQGAQLADVRTLRAGVETRARFSPVLTGTLGYRREERREGSAPRERRVTDTVFAGLSYVVSPRTEVSGVLGWSRVDRTGTEIRREEGAIGSLDITTDTPSGPIGVSLSAENLEAGQRFQASLNRGLELRVGALSGSIGAVRQPGGDTDVIGRIAFSQPLRTGSVNVALARTAVGNEDPRIRTTLTTGMTYQINSVSSFGLRGDYARTSGALDINRVEQAGVTASYSHQLTRDWALTSGVGYRVRNEADLGRARSPEVFIGLGRSFVWPL